MRLDIDLNEGQARIIAAMIMTADIAVAWTTEAVSQFGIIPIAVLMWHLDEYDLTIKWSRSGWLVQKKGQNEGQTSRGN